MAWYYSETPDLVNAAEGERWVQRGIVLQGGETASGAILDDAWLYDLSNRGTGLCPWIALPSLAGEARTRGSLVFDWADDLLILAGGYDDESGTLVASAERLVLPTTPANAAWTQSEALPAVAYTFSSLGDTTAGTTPIPAAACTTTLGQVCFGGGEGAFIDALVLYLAGELCDEDDVGLNTEIDYWWSYSGACEETYRCVEGNYEWEPSTPQYEACRNDPQCTDGAPDAVRSTASVAGLAELVGAANPRTGKLWWIGGTTGCEGTDCEAWESTFAGDGTNTQHGAAVNADAIIEAERTSSGFTDTVLFAPTTAAPSGQPETAAFGRRAAGGGALGLQWDHATRTLDAPDFRPVVVGGTLHQETGPGEQHSITCDGDDLVCDYLCFDFSDSWDPAPPVHSSEISGQVTDEETVASFDGTSWQPRFTVGRRLYPAVTGIGGDLLLVYGGETDGAANTELKIVDVADGSLVSSAESTALGGRVGARAVWDPITNSAYVFGGDPTDDGMFRVALDGEIVGGATSTWSVEDPDRPGTPDSLNISVATTDTSSWTTGATFDLTMDCDGDCFAEDIDLSLWGGNAEDAGTVSVLVRYSDASTEYTLTPWSLVTDAESRRSVAKVRLPRILSNGDVIHVEVSLEPRVVATTQGAMACTDLYDSRIQPNGTGCSWSSGVDTDGDATDEVVRGWTFQGIPALPTSLDGHRLSVRTTFSLPADLVGIAPGACEPADGVCGPFENDGVDSYIAHAMRGLQHVGLAPGSGTYDVDVWVDPWISIAETYVYDPTMALGLADDLAWLESRFTPMRNGTVNLVYLREQAVPSTTAGWALPGVLLTWTSAADGTREYGRSPRLTAIHELTHAWMPLWHGAEVQVDPMAAWMSEGLATLMEWQRAPTETYTMARLDGTTVTLPGYDILYPVAVDYADRSCADRPYNLELDNDEVAVRYRHGAYTLAQARFLWAATGHTEAAWWLAWQYFLDAHPAGFGPTEVDEFFSATLFFSYFYDELVDKDQIGIPLVALEAWSTQDGGSGGDTGDTADTAHTGDTAPPPPYATAPQVVVSQVQARTDTALSGCVNVPPVFHEVPYVLGCQTPEDLVTPQFEECAATTSAWSGDVRILDVESETIPLTRRAGYDDATDDPAWFAVLAQDALLPDNVPFASVGSDAAGARAYRWFLTCGPDDVLGECGEDVDGDGYPASNDCDDGEPTVHPGVEPGSSGLGVDDNCDGWE